MIRCWYVVDQDNGTRYEPGHDTEAAALTELADRYRAHGSAPSFRAGVKPCS